MPDTTARGNTIFSFLTTSSTASSLAPRDDVQFNASLSRYLSQPLAALYTYQIDRPTYNTGVPIAPWLSSPGVPWLSTPVAPWLGAVERRLNASIGVTGSVEQQDGTSLTKEVVTAANSFFAATSTVLPGEPYLYGLPSGELVAEFETDVGRMTIVISDETALALTVVNGQTIHKEIALQAATPETLQTDLSAIISRLGTDQHGSMDTGR